MVINTRSSGGGIKQELKEEAKPPVLIPSFLPGLDLLILVRDVSFPSSYNLVLGQFLNSRRSG